MLELSALGSCSNGDGGDNSAEEERTFDSIASLHVDYFAKQTKMVGLQALAFDTNEPKKCE